MSTIMIKVYQEQLKAEKDPINRKLLLGKIARAESPKGAKCSG